MSPEEVKAAIAALHEQHGITSISDIHLTTSGKAHWLYDKWMPAYADYPQEGGYHDSEAKYYDKNW